MHNSILLQFAAKAIFGVIILKSALNVQQAHLRRISVFCLEARFLAKFRLKPSYTTASYRNILAKIKPVAEAHNKKIVAAGILLGAMAENWLTALTNSSFADNYDVLALHPYSFPKLLSTHSFNGQTFSQLLTGIRMNWANNSVAVKPIWITEMGWLFNDTVTAIQREWGWIDASEWVNMLADMVSLCNYQDVERLFLYSFEDDAHIVPEQNHAGEKFFFGLQKKNGEMKLDIQALA